MSASPKRIGSRWAWYLLLVLPFIFTLFPQIYASATPVFLGFPYFYWYQLLWIILTAIITGFVYWMTPEPKSDDTRSDHLS